MAAAPRILVGIVGYYPFVAGYPLGSAFLQRLQSPPWPEDAEIREMNWSPVAIVQELQAAAKLPERVVLAAAADRGLPPGSVCCRRWMAGALANSELQARMFEAVTGVIHVDNLLALGEHFGVWPEEVLLVEGQLQYANVGDYVLHGRQTDGALAPDAGTEGQVTALVEAARKAVIDGAAGCPSLLPHGARDLIPVGEFCRHQFTSGKIVYTH